MIKYPCHNLDLRGTKEPMVETETESIEEMNSTLPIKITQLTYLKTVQFQLILAILSFILGEMTMMDNLAMDKRIPLANEYSTFPNHSALKSLFEQSHAALLIPHSSHV
jgi:hypothetical protein